jgi:hypothetical protein
MVFVCVCVSATHESARKAVVSSFFEEYAALISDSVDRMPGCGVVRFRLEGLGFQL